MTLYLQNDESTPSSRIGSTREFIRTLQLECANEFLNFEKTNDELLKDVAWCDDEMHVNLWRFSEVVSSDTTFDTVWIEL